MDWNEVKDYCRRNSIGDVFIGYHSYDYFTCILKRLYYEKLPIEVVDGTPDDAYARAKELFTEVEAMEDEVGFLKPEKEDKKTIVNCHERRLYGDMEVSFKKTHEGYVIQSITKKDLSGYSYAKEPYVPKNYYCKLEDSKNRDLLERSEKEKSYLQEGEELWIYDSIRALSGRSGFAVVKDGLVIKTKMVFMS